MCLNGKRRGVLPLVPPVEVFAIPFLREQVTTEAHAIRLYMICVQYNCILTKGYNYCCTHGYNPSVDIPCHFVLLRVESCEVSTSQEQSVKRLFIMSKFLSK